MQKRCIINVPDLSCIGAFSGFFRLYSRKCYIPNVSDINECSENDGGCEQNCENSHGSFVCKCNSGYQLNLDKRNCDGKRYSFILVTFIIICLSRQFVLDDHVFNVLLKNETKNSCVL